MKITYALKCAIVLLTTLTALMAQDSGLAVGSTMNESKLKGRDSVMEKHIKFETTLGSQGTLEFSLTLDKDWNNGFKANKSTMLLFEIPDLCKATIINNGSVVMIRWQWKADFSQAKDASADFSFMMPGFAGGGQQHFVYTWDSQKGAFDAYYNGYPLRIPGSKFKPWALKSATEMRVNDGDFNISAVKAYPLYMNEGQVKKISCPTGSNPFSVGDPSVTLTAVDTDKLRGDLLYDTDFSDPQFADWVAEGPVVRKVNGQWTSFSSGLFGTDEPLDGHIVWWCKEEFPESFIAEWDIQMETEPGLCIVFFAASAENGESIFDKSLPPRDGDFSQYILGKIKSYHISYYTNTPFNPGRIQANLRKNNHFFLMSQGPGGITPGSLSAHHVVLVKDKGKISLAVDGKTLIAYTDTGGDRYGPVYGAGRIGLRQMRWTKAAYKSFKVWALNDK